MAIFRIGTPFFMVLFSFIAFMNTTYVIVWHSISLLHLDSWAVRRVVVQDMEYKRCFYEFRFFFIFAPIHLVLTGVLVAFQMVDHARSPHGQSPAVGACALKAGCLVVAPERVAQ